MREEPPIQFDPQPVVVGLFAANGVAGTGLEAMDPRLDAISALSFKGQYLDEAAQAQKLWSGGVHDVRLIGHQLYGVFLVEGLRALPTLFGAITETLTGAWEALGPAQKKQALA